MRKSFLLSAISLLSMMACTQMDQDDPNEEPCVRAAQRTGTGLSAACVANYIYNGMSFGMITMTHKLDSSTRGCDTLNGQVTNQMMGNLTIDVKESTSEVKLEYKPGSFSLVPANSPDGVFISFNSSKDPRDQKQLVVCPGLTAEIEKLSHDTGTSCGNKTNMATVMESFNCPQLDSFAKKEPVIHDSLKNGGDMIAAAQAGSAHVLAGSMTQTVMKMGGSKRGEMLAPMLMVMKLMTMVMQDQDFQKTFAPGQNAAPGTYDVRR